MSDLVEALTDLPSYLLKRTQCLESKFGGLDGLDSLDEDFSSVLTRLIWLHPADGKKNCRRVFL